MIQQMTPRERTLATIVGAILFVFVNLFLIQYFMKQDRRLRSDRMLKTQGLAVKKALLADREVWEQRDQWLTQTFAKLTDPDRAPNDLRNAAVEVGKKHQITIENPSLGKAETKPQYIAVGMSFEVKCKWSDLGGFLAEIQAPDHFIAFDNANLQTDTTDKSLMHGRFKVQKWFAPK
jgi:hypothetical protein